MTAPADVFLREVRALLGVPYGWGFKGDIYFHGAPTPYFGADCSGVVTLALHRAGGPDWRATHSTDVLWTLPAVATPSPGDICLYAPRHPRDDQDVEHVTVWMGDGRVVGANGGGSRTLTLEIAKAQNAHVRHESSHLYRPRFAGFRRLPLTHGA